MRKYSRGVSVHITVGYMHALSLSSDIIVGPSAKDYWVSTYYRRLGCVYLVRRDQKVLPCRFARSPPSPSSTRPRLSSRPPPAPGRTRPCTLQCYVSSSRLAFRTNIAYMGLNNSSDGRTQMFATVSHLFDHLGRRAHTDVRDSFTPFRPSRTFFPHPS